MQHSCVPDSEISNHHTPSSRIWQALVVRSPEERNLGHCQGLPNGRAVDVFQRIRKAERRKHEVSVVDRRKPHRKTESNSAAKSVTCTWISPHHHGSHVSVSPVLGPKPSSPNTSKPSAATADTNCGAAALPQLPLTCAPVHEYQHQKFNTPSRPLQISRCASADTRTTCSLANSRHHMNMQCQSYFPAAANRRTSESGRITPTA